MCLYSNSKNAKTPNAYDNNKPACDAYGRATDHPTNTSKTTTRKAIPAPKAHQKASGDFVLATISALAPTVDAAQAAPTPKTIARRSSGQIAPAKHAATAPAHAASSAALAALLTAIEFLDEKIEPTAYPDDRPQQREPGQAAQLLVKPDSYKEPK